MQTAVFQGALTTTTQPSEKLLALTKGKAGTTIHLTVGCEMSGPNEYVQSHTLASGEEVRVQR